MALTITETKVLWAAGTSNTATVAAAGSQTSDIVTLDATCVAARITLKADNSTAPNADDTIDFYLLETSGDPDGTGSDEFTTPGHAYPLGSARTASEDPAIIQADVPRPQKSLQLYATGSRAAGSSVNSIVVSATITEQRSS